MFDLIDLLMFVAGYMGLTIVFSMLHFKKTVKVAEPNRAIKALELFFCAVTLGYAVWRLIVKLRRVIC